MKKSTSIFLALVLLNCALCAPMSLGAREQIGLVNTRWDALNVREQASLQGEILTCLEKGETVVLENLKDGWWRVEYEKGKYGYCSAQYIRKLDSESVRYVNTENDVLNVRNGGSHEQKVKDTLPKGTSVQVLSRTGDWSQIRYGEDGSGYVYNSYLSEIKPESLENILLSVTRYEQGDERWADVRLGNSDETLYSAGCTTTCLAMAESYRYDTEIYPDEMESRIYYASDGNLSWPEDYCTDSVDEGWKQRLLAVLKQGKPCIVGAKNESGGQHWVLAVGYHGEKNELSDSDFVILDPASHNRKTLARFLQDYPIFLKIAYYS